MVCIPINCIRGGIFMYSAEEIIDILDIRLSKKRYQHSLNVAEEARKLAGHFNYPDRDFYMTSARRYPKMNSLLW